MIYCKVDNCNNEIFIIKRQLCIKHYYDKKYRNDKLNLNLVNRKAIIHGNIAYIKLGGKRGGIALVDKKNAWVDQYGWSQNNNGYPHANIKGKKILLHILLFGKDKYLNNDHINRNKLDNRAINLRKVTPQQNNRNCKLSKNNKSGYTGVSFDTKTKTWVASIWVNYKRIHLGNFKNIDDAIECRKRNIKKYWDSTEHLQNA